ncbi:MFS transporter, partial [Bacillus sp. AFS001701]|uniref:MFS transporter n=1 Tax=Bacillus sp. AFS001701 TaxID=2033480 RepID=UPI0015967072
MTSKKSSMFSQLIAGYLLVIATSGFARLAYGVLMPSMQEDLAINYAQAGFLATIISLGFLVISTLIGILAQKFGIKKIVLAGGFLVTVCLFLLSFAKSYYIVMLIMFLLGAGSSLVFAPLMSLMVTQFANKKGLVLGILLSGVGSGMLLSGIITTNISDYFPSLGWRVIWTIFGIISLIVTLLSLFVLKEGENK